MSAEEGGSSPLEEEVPSAPGEAAPPGSEDISPPDPGDQAPPLLEEEAPPPSGEDAPAEEAQGEATSAGEAVSGEHGASISEKGPSFASDILSLIPSDERITFPYDDLDSYRVRPRSTPRLAQSVISEMLSQPSTRSSKFRRSMSGIPNLQETLKERQVLLLLRFFIYVTFISNEIFW